MHKDTKLSCNVENEEIYYTVAFNGTYMGKDLKDAYPKGINYGYYKFTNNIDIAVMFKEQSQAIDIVVMIRTKNRYKNVTAELIRIVVNKQVQYNIVPYKIPEYTEKTYHNFVRELVYYYTHTHDNQLNDRYFMSYKYALNHINKLEYASEIGSPDIMFKSARKELRYIFLFKNDLQLMLLSASRKDNIVGVACKYILHGKIDI